MPKNDFPEWVEDEHLFIIVAVVQWVRAAVEATKADGGSKTANEEEDRAIRIFVRSLGYSRESVAELAEVLRNRVG